MKRTVSPFRARSKRRAASSRAAGGREEGSGALEAEGWTEPFELGSLDALGCAFCAADWPYASSNEGIVIIVLCE